MEHFAPMMANIPKTTDTKGWVMEPKYDGNRIVVSKFGDKLSLFTRTFHDQLGKVPHIEAAFRSIPHDFVLDGEIVSIVDTIEIEGEEVPMASFEGALSVIGSNIDKAVKRQETETKLSFVAFDCLHSDGEDTMHLPDKERRRLARAIVRAMRSEYVLLTPRWAKFNEAVFDEIVARGGEGVMVKNPEAIYEAGKRPSKTWIKLKDIATADVVVMGYKEGNGKFADTIGAVEFGQYKDGVLVHRSRCSGMNDAMRIEISKNKDKFMGKVMEVKYFGRVGPEKSFRHPVFKAFRVDKLATDCVWE